MIQDGTIGTFQIGELNGDINGSVEIDDYDDEQIEINFNTAWGPPIEVCEKLRDMFPEVGFSWFYDEPGMETAGYL